NPGQLGQFTLNVQNTGNSDAWNATIVDKLPTGPTGGMCNMTPQVLSAQVFQADGVTPVAGKGPLKAGTDYTLSYAGAPAYTVTVVIPAVTITKQVTVVGGGPAVPGATLDYLVHVTNTSANPVNPVVITDNLNAAGAGALTYVAGTATMNGSPNGVSVVGNVITANYSATYGPLAPGGTIDLRFRATLGSTLAAGAIVTNTGVVTWNTPS